MINKICDFLTQRIKKATPEMTEEKAEEINYGLQLIIGELPKFFILLLIAYILNIWKLALLSFICILPYRAVSGGFHLHTHLGCLLCTTLIYFGNVCISQHIVFQYDITKCLVILITFIFGVIMIKLYAPADTENVPILRKKERRKKQILSYIILTINLLIAIVLKDNVISNLLVFGTLIQTVTITRFAYKLTKNQYGYEIYKEEQALSN